MGMIPTNMHYNIVSLLGYLALLGAEYYIVHNLVKGIVNPVNGDTKVNTT
jgi:hypothetical protein